jgi:hypothetical protein
LPLLVPLLLLLILLLLFVPAKPAKFEDDKFDFVLDNLAGLFILTKSFELAELDVVVVRLAFSFSFKFEDESLDDSFVREPNAIKLSVLNSELINGFRKKNCLIEIIINV